MTRTTVTIDGNEYDYEAMASLMDDDIREALHMELAPCTEQEFAAAYCEAHYAKHGVEFAIN